METPPHETIRRTTRSALTEIPHRMSSLSVSDESRFNTRTNANFITNIHVDVSSNQTPFMTPSPSPDEMVIQARGRRKIPITWSPPDLRMTPPGGRRRDSPNKDKTPNKNNVCTRELRSTPRKRLLMGDATELTPSPEKKSPASKKIKLDLLIPVNGSLDFALKALSHEQLMDIIKDITKKDPCLEEEIRQNLPTPDLSPINERLHDLKRNIFKSLPHTRLVSKTDSPAYNRASTHVIAFKKAVLELGKNLVASQQWESVIEYVLLAWEETASTPLWDNQLHNNSRKQCFKFLATQCMTALKKVKLIPKDEVEKLLVKFKTMVSDSDEIQACIKYLEDIKANHFLAKCIA